MAPPQANKQAKTHETDHPSSSHVNNTVYAVNSALPSAAHTVPSSTHSLTPSTFNNLPPVAMPTLLGKSATAFVILTHMHFPRTVYFLRVQGNEEFLGGSRSDPNRGLLHTLKEVRSVVIGECYCSLEQAKSLMRQTLHMLGFIGHVFDVLITTRWTPRLWDESGRSLINLLEQRVSTADPLTNVARNGGNNTTNSLLTSTHLPRNLTNALEKLQQRNQYAVYRVYAFQYQHFCSWVSNILDEFRGQLLPRLPFLVFQHCYFDLLMHSSSENAVLFFERFAPLFDRTGVYSNAERLLSSKSTAETAAVAASLPGSSVVFVTKEFDKLIDNRGLFALYGDKDTIETLRAMRHIQTREQMVSSEMCRYLRVQRDPVTNQFTMRPLSQMFYLSSDCMHFLQHSLTVSLMPKIATVMRTYINFSARSRRNDNDVIVVQNVSNWQRGSSFSSLGHQPSECDSSAEFACRAMQLDYTLNFAAFARAKMEALDRKYAHLTGETQLNTASI
jgi:hypothetical protein